MDVESLRANTGGARKIARKLLKDAKISEIPVSLQKILDYVKSQQDLSILKFNFGDKISGMLVNLGESAAIGFNPDNSWVRRRFTIAHELGHLYMGHTCGGEGKTSTSETEANQFAAELLVPLAFLKKDFVKQRDLDVLAKKYIVSKEALCLHLMECKIF